MRILMLYRPHVPGQGAQDIQVMHSAWALAEQGHQVTVLANRGPKATTPQDGLGHLGLPPQPGLDLRMAPVRHSGLAGIWFRRQLREWWGGPAGVVIARDLRRLGQILDRGGPHPHHVVIEAHGLGSLWNPRGVQPSALATEVRALSGAHALVCNSQGTLDAWTEAHGPRLPARTAVVMNATSASRRRDPVSRPPAIVRVVGSLRAYKGIAELVALGPGLPMPLELAGGTPAEWERLGPLPEQVRLLPSVPYPAVPDLLAHARALILPLADNVFGRRLTNPLKLWDYLGTSVPLVLPDLPSIRNISLVTPAHAEFYRPGDPDSLVSAVRSAVARPPRAPVLRTWAQRATEMAALLP